MANNTIYTVFEGNPASSMDSTDLLYLGRSPYNAGEDFAITFADFVASLGTITPTALTLPLWDGNYNLSANNFLSGYTAIVSAAATTTLTDMSTYIQNVTGTMTQNIVMPVVTTLKLGFAFKIINDSSSAVTVKSSGGNTIQVMAANTILELVCVLITGTTAASWSGNYLFLSGDVQSITGTANQVIASSATGAVTLSLPQSIATTSNPTFAALTLNSLTFATTSGIIGTTSNALAAAGSVGQVISNTVLYASSISMLGDTPADITYITLTSGAWLVIGNFYLQGATSANSIETGWISTTSATEPDAAYYSSVGAGGVNSAFGAPTPSLFVHVANSTTQNVYLSALQHASSGTLTGCGSISAMRIY